MKFININYYNNEYEENTYVDTLLELENEIKEYNIYFDSIKNHFSKIFRKKYFNCEGFHDWRLISIEYSEPYSNKKTYLTVTLYNQWDNITKKMVYSGVRNYNVNFSKEHFITYDTYGLDEFILLDDSYFSHEVLFPSGSSYYVEFKKIKIE